MVEITPENVLDYLREHGWVQPGPARAESLGGGVSNQVLRIADARHCFVVKQSRPQLRTRDAWFSDLDRIWREQEVMQALLPMLPSGTVPAILFVDRENYLYGMSHAPLDARVWKEILLSGTDKTGKSALSMTDKSVCPTPLTDKSVCPTPLTDKSVCPTPLTDKSVCPTPLTDKSVCPTGPDVAHLAGVVLGMMHEKTAAMTSAMEPFRDHTVYVQLRVDPFYRRIQERRPEVAHVVAGIVEEMLSRKAALCHGDYTPKNMLVHSGGFMLVDYETAHFGDPTMDLGLFLTHILLKACRAGGDLSFRETINRDHAAPASDRAAFIELARSFWKGYASQVAFQPLSELQARGVRHLGVCLLARIDGTSPVDYLSEPQRDAMRRLGRRILLDGLTTWDEALAVAEAPPLSPGTPGERGRG